MRHSFALGSTLGVLAVASACATTANAPRSSSRFEPTPTRVVSRSLSSAQRDSAFAQAIADREGPGVTINAELSVSAGGRHVRAHFHVDDDAYVVVGHIDADGVVRIVFPEDPRDDGFVKGDKSYSTNEFFAGFNDQYRYRAQTRFTMPTASAGYDSYDGGLGYVFVIASWRPMRFDRFTTEGKWDSFELADADYLRDPRPAIGELASLLAGDNREAYTVKFARYTNTIASSYSGFDDVSSLAYCTGFAPLGFASSPFGLGGFGYGYDSFARYGYNFNYRGSNYYYDAAGDCYRQGSFGGYGYGGYRIVQGLPVTPPPTTTHPRTFDLDGHRSPPSPKPRNGLHLPQNAKDAGAPTTNAQGPRLSPEYRQRGLITTDEPATGPARRSPRVEVQGIGATDDHSRPTIQEMVNRRGQNTNDGTTNYGTRARYDGSAPQSGSQPAQQSRPRYDPGQSGTGDAGRTYQRPVEQSSQPRSAPVERPQVQQSAPRSEPRSEPARMAPPPSSPPPSSPPPASTPRSEPASSSSSGAPIKPPAR